MAGSTFVYVTYIRTSPEALWEALTSPAFMKQYWFGMHIEAEWKTGASWKMLFPDGRVADTGEITAFDPPKRLALRWRNEFKPELKEEGYSVCVMEIEPQPNAAKLTVTHGMERDLPDSGFIKAVSGGWPRVLSNLKSLLETGEVVAAAHPEVH